MFERYVQAQGRRSTAKRLLIAGSVLIHAALIALLIVWSFFRVEEVQPPPLTITFFAATPPPPPPPPPAGKKAATIKVPRPPVVQPTEVKPLVQPKTSELVEDEGDEADEEGGVAGGVAGGVKGGVVGGVIGGVSGGVVGSPLPPPPVKPKNVPAHALDAQVIFRPDPHLPEVVKTQRRGMGEVMFTAKVCIDREGKVFEIHVLQGIAGADEAILATIRQWRYKPQPIPLCFIANWVFTVE